VTRALNLTRERSDPSSKRRFCHEAQVAPKADESKPVFQAPHSRNRGATARFDPSGTM